MARTHPARPADPLIGALRLLAIDPPGTLEAAPEGWSVVTAPGASITDAAPPDGIGAPAVLPGEREPTAPEAHGANGFDASFPAAADLALVDAVLIGSGADSGVRIARSLRRRDPALQIVLLVDAHSHDAGHGLAIRGLVGDVWTLPSTASTAALWPLLGRAADTTRRRRELRATMAGINARLVANREHAIDVRRRLEISDRYLATLLAHAPDAIVSLDAAGRVTSWNAAARQLLGHDSEDVIDRPFVDLFPAWVRGDLGRLLEAVRDGRPVEAERITSQRADGLLFEGELTLGGVHEPGAASAVVVGILRDVTSQVIAEEELHLAQIHQRRLAAAERLRAAQLDAVIRSIGDAVLVLGRDGEILLRNPAADALLPGVALARYDDLLDHLVDGRERAPRGGEATERAVELAVAGTNRWFELRSYPIDTPPAAAVAPLRSNRRRPRGIPGSPVTLLVVRDVTEARQAQAARDLFLGIISHELRTPITTIYGGSRLLGRVVGTPRQAQIVSDIEDEADRLYRLVEDLLVLTRVERGALQVLGEPVLLQRLVPRVVKAEGARSPETTYRVHLPPDAPPVLAEASYVEQVLRNFLDNAAKYGGPGRSVDVRVEVGDGEVAVRVLDEGPGFEPGEADRLFDLFYRSDATARTAKGAGIGLFVSRHLIVAMGGRIWASPRPGRGAEFGFVLPVAGD